MTVNWTYTRDAAKPEDGFIVSRKEDGGAFAELGRVAAGIFTFNDTTAVAGHDYDYKVMAHFADGTSCDVPGVTNN